MSLLDQRPLRFLPSLLFVLIVALVLYPFLHDRLQFPPILPPVPPEARQLPIAALASFLRMAASYAFCLVFAIGLGMWAALDRRARGWIIPILDILQSVPILGFFPAAILFFVTLFHGARLGVEFASVFLLVTCMAWNMAFGVYEAMITRSQELDEVSHTFNLPPLLRFLRIYLPVLTPKLLYNSMISWANGWYFLVAAEIIAIGPAHYQLRGLGSFLSRSAASGDFGLFGLGLAMLTLIIVTLDLFIWRPLISWAERFRPDQGEPAVLRREAPFAQLWSGIWKSALVEGVTLWLRETLAAWGLVAFRGLERFWRRRPRLVPSPARRALKRVAGWALLAAIAILGVWATIAVAAYFIRKPPSGAVRSIPLFTAVSMLRLALAYAICLLWTVPAALLISYRPRVGRILIAICEILAAIPATAFFPILVSAFGRDPVGRETTAVLLALTGMQWYLLFNLVAGIRSIPTELTEATRSMGLTRSQVLRRLIFPASLSSLITGSVTAWGGGWNSLIISEYFVYRGETYSVKGLGALLSRATYELGDLSLLLVGLAAMILTITLVNRLVWRPLYELSATRYRIEG